MLEVGLVGDTGLCSDVVSRAKKLGATILEAVDQCDWDHASEQIGLKILSLDAQKLAYFDSQIVVGVMRPGHTEATDAVLRQVDVLVQPHSKIELEQWVDELWGRRIVPFESNLRLGHRAPRILRPALVAPRKEWGMAAARLIGRLTRRVGYSVIRIDHIGSTSVPDLIAKDLIDIQIVVKDEATGKSVANETRRAGFVHVAGPWFGVGHGGVEYPEDVVVDADPGRSVNVNIRAVDAPVWTDALLFRDWLRASDEERDAYQSLKVELASAHSQNVDTYGRIKVPWILQALSRAESWALATRWSPNNL